MTCIVGYVQKGKTFIGADSAGVAGMNVTIRKDPKVFKVGEFVIGCTSSFRMIQLIRFTFQPAKKHDDTDTFQYMCTSFINELRKCFKEGGFAARDKDVESGGTFLVGYKGRLFMIGSDYQVAENEEGYDSVGCGESFALGALDMADKKMSAIDIINRALAIAAHRSGGVRPPFIIEST